MKRRTAFWIIVCLGIFNTGCTTRQASPDTTIGESATAPAATTLTPTVNEAADAIPNTEPVAGESEATENTTDDRGFTLVKGIPTDVGISVMELVNEQSQQPLDHTQPHEVAVDATHRLGIPLQFPAWCAVDEATVRANIEQTDYLITVEGETHNLGDEFGWEFDAAPDKYCAFVDAYLVFSDPGEHQVQFTVRMNAEVNDGWDVYQPGDRVYELNLEVQ